MKVNKLIWVFMVMIIGTILTACKAEPVVPEDESISDPLPPVAVIRAREVLADDLGVGVEAVDIESYEPVDWSDSCLGLGGPAESCLAAITPGWRVNLLVNGSDSYEVRTDELGEIVRINK
ncbi:MAG: hypothetical protein JSV42_07130 [Chloroflexota bacterium]|nr:MAG: hypothetical protein JSV42_07130 [Chloroflexota bacterium]